MDLSSLCSKLLPGFTTLGFKDERRSKGESVERGPGGSSMVVLTHLLSGLYPDSNLKVVAMKLHRTSSPMAICSLLVGGSQPRASWNSLDGLPPATVVAAGTLGARSWSSGGNFIFSNKLTFHLFGGVRYACNRAWSVGGGLHSEGAGPAGAGPWPHFYTWSAFWFWNVSVCAAVCSQRTFCHNGVLLAPSRERPGCCLPFRTPDANLQAPDSIHGDASTCLLQGSHHQPPLRPLGKS